jgi:hypothetical protein
MNTNSGLEEAKLDNLLDFNELPAFDEPFARLVKETIKCTDDLMETLRNEGHMFSYENFVATLGGEPGHIFSIFGVKLVEKHRMGFLNAWMMASFLRQTPMIYSQDDEGFFDMDLFDKVEWARLYGLKRRDKRMDFLKAFGLRKSYEGNLHTQFGEDLSKASPRSTGQEPPATRKLWLALLG